MKLTMVLTALAAVGLAYLMACSGRCTQTCPAKGNRRSGPLHSTESLNLGGVTQWIYIDAKTVESPVLLFLHGGPGTPETPFLQRYNGNLHGHFVVVSWEQRGAGKSYSKNIAEDSMTLEQFIQDTHELTQILKKRFGQDKLFLVGHSWGTLLGMHVVARHPDDYHAFVSVSQTSHTVQETLATFHWLMAQATQEGNQKALQDLAQIQPLLEQPLALRHVSALLKWVDHYGGAAFYGQKSFRRLVWNVITTNVYTPIDKINYLRGEAFSLQHLFAPIQQADLFAQIPEVMLPVIFVHGRHDYQVPMSVARNYYEHIKAPHKTFVVFENAAHAVLYEDPERFCRLMLNVFNEHG